MQLALKRHLTGWFSRKRSPDAAAVVLSQRRIYILPTRYGYLFALALLLMLSGSVNYNLSLGFVLTFLLCARFRRPWIWSTRRSPSLPFVVTPAPCSARPRNIPWTSAMCAGRGPPSAPSKSLATAATTFFSSALPAPTPARFTGS